MFSRRGIIQIAGAATATSFVGNGFAAGYPTKPIHIINETAAGGTADVMARLVAQHLQDTLGQPVLVDNRPGAGGNIAREAVLRVPADGYTLASISKGAVFANLLDSRLSYDFLRDFTPVSPIGLAPLVMLVHPSVPAKTLPEFIAWAKANPGKVNFGSAGNGSDPHLTGELLKMAAGIDMTHVPFRGGALALTDLLAGGVQLMFSNLPVGDYLKEGSLRGLGVTTARRSDAYPDIPPMAETLPEFNFGVWIGIVARTGTPIEIIEKLNADIRGGFNDAKFLAGLRVLNAAPMPMSPTEMSKLFADEIERWGKVIKVANIKAE